MGLFSKPDPAKLMEKRDVRGLSKLLSSKDAAERRVAAQALGEIGDPSSSDALLRALDDPDDGTAAAAAYGFVGISGAQAWPALGAWWSSAHDGNRCVFVAGATAQAGDPLATDLLLTMSAHSSEGVRATAFEGLGLLASKGALPQAQRERVVQALCAALEDTATVRLAAAEALGALGEPAALSQLLEAAARPATTEDEQKAATAVRAALAALGPPSSEELLGLLTGDAEQRRVAVGWLRKEPRPDDPLTGAWFRALTGDWAGGDPMKMRGGREALQTLLADSEYARLVMAGLGSAGEAIVPMLEAELTRTTWLAPYAFQALCAMKSPRARAAAASGYEGVVARAGGNGADTCRAALARMGGAEALEALIRELSCADWSRRVKAAEALGLLGDRAALPALQVALADPFSQAQVTAAAPDQYADDFVREAMLRTTDVYPVRDAARRAIERLGGLPTPT